MDEPRREDPAAPSPATEGHARAPRSQGARPESVLPSFALWPVLLAAAWVAAGPFVWTDASTLERIVLGPLPAGVVASFTVADYAVWRRRARPWHDWTVILLLLPPIAASVWLALGPLLLRAGYGRDALLGLAVGPGVALVGLLCTTISYHGRHRPHPA